MKISLIIKIFLLISFLLFNFFSFRGTKAGTNENVSGWAWSDNIGWISFNNTTDGSSYNYGVNIDSSTGLFSGYAWSDNIGWISFNETELTGCPSGTCRAKLSFSTNEVSGWAKVLNTVAGWDGWISLRDTNYGVSLNGATNELEGWVWSDDFGWISFNCITDGTCATSDYKVTADINFPPNKPQSTSETWDYSAWGSTPQALPGTSLILSWVYSDPDSNPQDSYEIWVDDDSAFTGSKFNIIVDPSGSTSYALDLSADQEGDWLSQLNWNSTYYWQVRVKNNVNPSWSEWSDIDSFSTRDHANPYPDFIPIPQNPAVDEVVVFIQDDSAFAESLCYNDVTGDGIGEEHQCQEDPFSNITYEWNFDYPSGPTSDKKGNASTTYSGEGSYTVRLLITDNTLPIGDNFSFHDVVIDIGSPLPEWREVSPF